MWARFNANNIDDDSESAPEDELPSFSSDDSDPDYTLLSCSDSDDDDATGRTYGYRDYARRIQHLQTRMFPSSPVQPSVTSPDLGYLLAMKLTNIERMRHMVHTYSALDLTTMCSLPQPLLTTERQLMLDVLTTAIATQTDRPVRLTLRQYIKLLTNTVILPYTFGNAFA